MLLFRSGADLRRFHLAIIIKLDGGRLLLLLLHTVVLGSFVYAVVRAHSLQVQLLVLQVRFYFFLLAARRDRQKFGAAPL